MIRRRSYQDPSSLPRTATATTTTTATELDTRNVTMQPKPPICANCAVTDSPQWRKGKVLGEKLCNACAVYLKKYHTHRPSQLWEGTGSEERTGRTASASTNALTSTSNANTPAQQAYTKAWMTAGSNPTSTASVTAQRKPRTHRSLPPLTVPPTLHSLAQAGSLPMGVSTRAAKRQHLPPTAASTPVLDGDSSSASVSSCDVSDVENVCLLNATGRVHRRKKSKSTPTIHHHHHHHSHPTEDYRDLEDERRLHQKYASTDSFPFLEEECIPYPHYDDSRDMKTSYRCDNLHLLLNAALGPMSPTSSLASCSTQSSSLSALPVTPPDMTDASFPFPTTNDPAESTQSRTNHDPSGLVVASEADHAASATMLMMAMDEREVARPPVSFPLSFQYQDATALSHPPPHPPTSHPYHYHEHNNQHQHSLLPPPNLSSFTPASESLTTPHLFSTHTTNASTSTHPITTTTSIPVEIYHQLQMEKHHLESILADYKTHIQHLESTNQALTGANRVNGQLGLGQVESVVVAGGPNDV